MRVEERTHAARRRTRVATGHVCPDCRRSWALKAVQGVVEHPSGAVVPVLAITCQFCTYRRAVARSTHTGGPLLVMVEQAADATVPEAKPRTA